MALALDTITFDQLARESAWLGRLARSLVSDPAVAEDAVQDTYEIAAREAPTDGRPLKPWLARVLVNRVRMWGRGGARRRVREEAVAELATPPATPDELVARLEMQRLVTGFVLDLPRAQRDVVLMHYVEGMTSAAIGNRLGISDGTVRWRLKQAIDELRARLDEKDPKRAWAGILGGLAGTPRVATSSAGFVVGLAAVALAIALLVVIVISPWTPDESTAPNETPLAGGTHDDPRLFGTAASPSSSAVSGDLGDVALNTDTKPVTGMVFDQDNHPVAGAAIALHSFDLGWDKFEHVTSNADGKFALPPLDPDSRYQLMATEGDRSGNTVYGNSLRDRPLVIKILRLAVATVHVVDAETGSPIEGATVATSRYFQSEDSEVVTDASGAARIRFRPQVVRVAAEGYAAAQVQIVDQLDYGVDPDPRDYERTIKLVHGITIGGTVQLVPDHRPLTDGWVRIYDAIFEGRAEIDARGAFTVRVPKPGTYHFEAASDRASTRDVAIFTIAAAGRMDLALQVEPRGSIAGTVVDGGGHAVAGAAIHTSHRRRAATTDARGRFEVFLDWAGPPTHITAVGGDLAATWEPVSLDDKKHTEVQLQLGASGITGTVIDLHGEPVADADVWLNPVYGGNQPLVDGRGVKTDANGRFAFTTPRGNLVLSVRRDSEYDYDTKDDVVIAGGSRNVRLVVP